MSSHVTDETRGYSQDINKSTPVVARLDFVAEARRGGVDVTLFLVASYLRLPRLRAKWKITMSKLGKFEVDHL